MKLKLTTTIIAIASCAIAQAEPDKEKKKGPKGPRQVPKEILEKFDKDGDGKLNEEDIASSRRTPKNGCVGEVILKSFCLSLPFGFLFSQ